MEKTKFNPAEPKEVAREVFEENKSIIDQFAERYSQEILEFSEGFSHAYRQFRQFDRITANDERAAYVAGLIFALLDNLLVSMKLLVAGHLIPSGNLMRQATESTAVAILCSSKEKVVVQGKKGKRKVINYFNHFKSGSSVAQSSKALNQLELNKAALGIRDDAIEKLKAARKFYHQYSHPSMLSLGVTISHISPNIFFMGGSFDEGKIEAYQKEIKHRIGFSHILPNLIDALFNILKPA